jgi:uncharacterized membrane protein/protein-disulfide isomerase
MGHGARVAAIVAVFGALLGLVFASYSTLDYAAHLDRQLHDVHCSVIPGAPPQEEAEGCRAALYSPYSAVMKDQLWGGLPISLFAQGAFSFLAGFALFLAIAGNRASKVAAWFFAAVSVTPLIVSIVMLIISVTQLNTVCKTCAGIYISSALVGVGGLWGLMGLKHRENGSVLLPLAWLAVLGIFTLMPTAVYASTAPDHSPYLEKCGKLQDVKVPAGALLKMSGRNAKQRAVFFEDPLCPTCKAVHMRLANDGVLDRIDVTLVMMPLDSRCNWMLEQPMHPGACTVSKAVLCAGERAKQVLEWAYDEQDYLTRAGKKDHDLGRKDEPVMKEVIKQRWGADLVSCIEAKATEQRLNQHLQYAVDNSVPVSTPQIYLGGKRLCDEDTDIGLRFTLSQIAPEVLP